MADKEKPEAEEEEYESDLDDAPLSALWRRDAASDDEGEDEDPEELEVEAIEQNGYVPPSCSSLLLVHR